jgi:5'-phosphate synthase pdxT subunit
MPFIRAPFVSDAESARVLAIHDSRTVAVKQGAQLACAFHPELTDDSTVYDMFLNDCSEV